MKLLNISAMYNAHWRSLLHRNGVVTQLLITLFFKHFYPFSGFKFFLCEFVVIINFFYVKKAYMYGGPSPNWQEFYDICSFPYVRSPEVKRRAG